MKKILFLTFFAFFSLFVMSQNIWMVNSTSDATAESMDIVLDAEGNSYITGYISGDTEFQDIQIDISTGYSDVIVAKINPDGKYLWVKKFTGPLSDKGAKIALTSTNEIIITGTFYNSITFGTTTLTATNGSKDIFLTKLSNDGNVIWARKDGGALGDNVYGLELDNNNNIIITGQFEGTSTIGAQTFTSMVDPNTSLPSFDMFLAKFDGDGNSLWAKASFAEYEDRGLSVACDVQNNIYLCGQFSDTINFFGQTINNQIFNAGFVSKFAPDGNNLWFDKLAAGQVLAYDLTINNQNKIIVTGDFLGQLVVWAQEGQHVLTNPYSRKVFVLKLDLQGNYIWSRAKGSDSEVSSRSVCVDAEDNIYIGGHFRCNFDEYRDSTGTAHWQSAGFRDQFVTKFTTNGTTLWKNHVGGQREDQCWGIAIFESDYPIITGSYATNIVYPFNDQYNIQGNIPNSLVQNYNFNSDNITDGVKHLLVVGDESINIHISKMVNSHSKYYNYYNHTNGQNLADSMIMFITPNQDSVDFCPPERACVNTNTNTSYGPLYMGNWNTGIQWYDCVDAQNNDGLYSVLINRQDLCYDFDDTIYIDYHPYPTIPSLTDDHNVNNSSQNYTDIFACSPDTLNFHFQNLCIGCTSEILFNPFINSLESLALDSNYQTSVDSYIKIIVTTDFGCSKTEDFIYRLVKDIKPYLLLNDPYDHNDSIMICKGSPVQVLVADSITNPNRNLIDFNEIVHSASVTITHNGQLISISTTGHSSTFYPTEDGWYVVNQNVTIGVLPCIFPHQIMDSFYVEIKENPNLTFIGGGLLCPDEYNFLSVSPVIPGLVWTGPAILWTSPDSIKLNESGWYSVSGSYNYGEITCPFTQTIHIDEKAPPLILIDPIDGIVCPGDSVLLSLNQEGIHYEWIGPEGDVVSFDSATYVVDQGFYACIFTDMDGCQLLTAQAEVKEYTSPFIELSPTNVICEMEPITLTAIHGGLATILWHQPINSTSESVVVTQAGTYACSVTQCGMTVIDSITVVDGSYELNISTAGTNLCIGDTLNIQATPGLEVYQWSNGFSGQNFLEVVDAGTYSVQTWNQYGCVMKSDSITIYAYPESYPPLLNDTFVCVGGNIDLIYSSTFDFNWYYSPNISDAFSTQDTISFTSLMADTSIFIAHNSTNCPLNFTEVEIKALMPLTPPLILGDTTICIGDNANFQVNPITNGTYSWIYDGNTISTTNTVSVANITLDSPTSFQILMTDGCTDTESQISIIIKTPSPIAIDHTSDTLCYGEILYASASGLGNIQYVWSDGISSWNSANLAVSYFDIASNTISVYGINSDGCHSEILSLEVTQSPDLNLGLTIDTLTCLGNDLTLSAIDTLGEITWLIPNGNTITDYEIYLESIDKKDNGLYIANIINNYNCFISDTLTIDVLDLPYFTSISDSILCMEEVYNIQFPNYNYNFVWNNTITDSIFTPNGNPILLSAIDVNGCVFSDTINISLVDCTGQAANVITTNNDGINEYFTIFNSEYSYNNCLTILNRWGNVVYEKSYYRNDFNGYTNDGKKLNDGVYFYLYYRECGSKKEITHQGYLQIISD